jgi:tetratricopeptide (TPR) repeat protein
MSRRRRQLLVTSGLGGLFVVVASAGVWLAARPGPAYRPGERVAGLTAGLARELPADYPRVSFTDVTSEAGVVFRHFAGVRSSQLAEDMGSGAAWGDFDNDGWLDLYVLNEAGPLTLTPDEVERSPAHAALYHNRRDGTFREVSEQAGVRFRGWGMGVTSGDYDNDGWLDLFVSAYGENVLYRNDGDGTFTDKTAESGLGGRPGFWAAARWGDYDRDGYLDLYVTGYVRYRRLMNDGPTRQYGIEQPASINPSSFSPEQDLLYRNAGDGTFREVAAQAGLTDTLGRSLGAVWADFDGDGWPDLYVANDVSDNVMYRNQRDGTFKDVSLAARVADYRGAMGLAVGDWDGDADEDLFITHWLAQENALYTNLLSESRGHGTRASEPLLFMDEADRYGLGQVALPFVGWGTSFIDYDNDGRLDLFVVNGSTLQQEDDQRSLVPMESQLFWNRGADVGFYDLSPVGGEYFARPSVGRGAAFGDYDNDGDVDAFVVNHGGPGVLLRNDGGNRNPWLAVRLIGGRSNRSAIGAKLRLVTGAAVQVREVGAQGSYLSHNSLVEHFGLGALPPPDSLEITWPSGARQVVVRPGSNQILEVTEGVIGSSRQATARGPAVTPAEDRNRVRRFWEAYRRATDHRIAGRYREAADEYTRALALNSDHHDALYYLGSVEFDLGDLPAAERAWLRLTEVDATSSRAHSRLGALHFCVGGDRMLELRRAAAEFERAAAINREETGPLLSLGEVALVRGDLEDARHYFDAVIGSHQTSLEAHFYEGFLAWKAGALAEASERLDVAAGLVRPAASGGRASGEGDTRGGVAPMTRAPTRCGALRARVVELATRDAVAADRVGSVYREFDAFLEEVREKLPE